MTVDTCIHQRWVEEADVHPYLDKHWREYVGKPNSLPGGGGAKSIVPRFRYINPAGEDLRTARPGERAPAGSSYELLAEQALDANGIDRALLLFDQAMFAPALPNPFLATAVVKAINDWNVDQWLARDERLYGAALVPVQMPDEAAAEIRRIGQHPKIAGVLLAAGLGKLLGHPLYFPIYEAASELDLPIVIHRGIDGIAETQYSSGPAGGPPMTFAEYDTIAPLALMSQVLSLMTNGVFAKYPTLRVYVVGAGVTWVPGWLRRMEMLYVSMRREIPWMRKGPTEYLHENVRVSTYGLERGSGQMLKTFLDGHTELQDVFCFGSGYPSWDTTTLADIKSVFPETWHAPVLRDNAESWLRWSLAGAPT